MFLGPARRSFLAGLFLFGFPFNALATTGASGNWHNPLQIAPDIETQALVDLCVNGQGGPAIEACTRIVELPLPASSLAWAFFDRGLAFFDQKDFAHAIADFSEGLKGKPDDDRAYYYSGWAKYLRGDLTGAISDLNRAISIAGNKPEYLYLRGRAFAAATLNDLAIKDYSAVISQGTADGRVYQERGIVLYLKADYAAATTDLDKAIQLDSSDAKAHEFRGKIYAHLNQFDRAIDEYNKAINANKGLTYPYLERAITERRLKQFQSAIDDLNVFVTAHSDDPEAFVERSFTLRVAGHLDLALNDADAALKIAPEDPVALAERGVVLSKLGRDEEALKDLNKAILIKPDSKFALESRASLHLKMGQYGVAVDDYSSILRTSPGDPIALNNRCWARALENTELDLALDDCNKSLAIRPTSSPTLGSRSFVNFRLGQFQNAVADSTAALAIDPQSADALYIRALAKSRLGDASDYADVSSSLAIKPTIAKEYESYGATMPEAHR